MQPVITQSGYSQHTIATRSGTHLVAVRATRGVADSASRQHTSVTHITISERTITMHVTLSQEHSRAPCFFTSLNTQSIWSSRTCGIRVRHRQSTMSNNYLALVPPVAAPLEQPEPAPLLCSHALQPLLLSDASDATRNAGRQPQADF